MSDPRESEAREVLAQAMGRVVDPDRDYATNPLYDGDPAWRYADAALPLTRPTSDLEAVKEACAAIAEGYPSTEYADIPVIRGIAFAIRNLPLTKPGETM